MKYFDNPLHSDALNWLTDVDTWLPSEGTKTTMVTGPNGEDQSLWEVLWVERYALVVLFYDTNGNGWTINTGWLSDQSICDWYNKASAVYGLPICNEKGRIIDLQLCKC